MDRHDLVIVGAGPVGMALALALKDAGLDILLVDARARGAARHDPRVLALAHGTRLTLERLGVWTQLRATPIETIHVSQQGGFGRSLLRATDYEQPALGYVVAAGDLAAALDDALLAARIPVRGDAS
ncbi:MAG TPA: FAD-dependent monooxygenase, partial [Rhodocyclaceae bacterium]|nr:FAD-dependent monooxygenase [Rhodocyclaceae bacterium]